MLLFDSRSAKTHRIRDIGMKNESFEDLWNMHTLIQTIISSQFIKMSKIERLNTRVEKLLSKAVQEVLEVVKETVSEYQEKTARTQRENQSLKRRLQELEEKLQSENNGMTIGLVPLSRNVKSVF